MNFKHRIRLVHNLLLAVIVLWTAPTLAQTLTLRAATETAKGEYGPVEDMHMFLNHLIGTYLIRVVRAGTGRQERDHRARRD